jgi:hypothetical protein
LASFGLQRPRPGPRYPTEIRCCFITAINDRERDSYENWVLGGAHFCLDNLPAQSPRPQCTTDYPKILGQKETACGSLRHYTERLYSVTAFSSAGRGEHLHRTDNTNNTATDYPKNSRQKETSCQDATSLQCASILQCTMCRTSALN